MDVSNTYHNILQQKRQQLIFNSLTDAVLIETASRTIEFVNPSFCALFKLKFSPEEMVGKNTTDAAFASIFLFKNPSKFIYRVEEIIDEAVSISQEKVMLHNGTTYLRDYFPLIINNTLTGHLWLYKAVTETPFNNGINDNLSSIFEKVLETISLPIAIFNQDQRYLYINKIALPNDDKRKFIIGKTDSEFCNYYNLPNQAATKQTTYFQLALAQQKEVRYEAETVNKKGLVTHQQHIFYPLSLPETSEIVVVKYSINITALKQSEVALQQTIANYTNILNSLNDVVILADDKLKVDFLNKVWNNYFISSNDNSIFNLLSIKNYEFYQQAFAVLNDGSKKLSGKINFIQKDGSKKWFKYNIGAGVANNTNDKGIVAILNDITSDVLLEENLLEVVKREKELNDLKWAFVNMVSHELRTPLAVISSGAEIIQMMLAVGKPAAEIEAYTVQIITEVERMTAFMNDLLMVSKIEAGKIEFHPQLTDIHAFINELTTTSYAPFKDGRSLGITTKGTLQNLAVDTKMLRHILQNLIDNAFKYSTNKQSPQLRLRYSKTYVTISVIDTGIGIHKDDIAKLFASFSRGRNVANIAGTGMGLVVVKYFVSQHMGTIFIKSKIDIGTIFSVKIPYHKV
jgi:signal transduction histidine kinase